jgi:hypothetical protein
MNIARAVRQIYEKRPYPNLRSSAVANRRWRLPPLPWIKVIWQRHQPPRRILIAGCGIGSEAFTFRRRFPHAEIDSRGGERSGLQTHIAETAFVELEVQLAVKGIAFYEKACFASVARCTTKVPYTAVGSAW